MERERCASQDSALSLYLIPATCFHSFITNSSSVSADTAISIVFGLIGILLGVVSIFISYLTLRAMAVDHGTNSCVALSLLFVVRIYHDPGLVFSRKTALLGV